MGITMNKSTKSTGTIRQVTTAKYPDLEDEIHGLECDCESAETFIACRINREHPGAFTREIINRSRSPK